MGVIAKLASSGSVCAHGYADAMPTPMPRVPIHSSHSACVPPLLAKTMYRKAEPRTSVASKKSTGLGEGQ